MRERTNLWIRFALIACFAVAGPFVAYSSPYGFRGWSLAIMEAFLVSLAAFLLWRIRRTPAEARVTAGLSPETVRHIASKRSRFVALAVLAGAGLLIANEYYGIVHDWRLHFVTVLMTPMFVLAGLGGVIHPDVMFGARSDIPDIPEDVRRISRVLVFGGLGIGLYGCYYYFIRR